MQAVTNERLLAAVEELTAQVAVIAEILDKQQSRKTYQKEYYKKRKAVAAAKKELEGRLVNKDAHCLDGPCDNRLPIQAWAEQLRAFAARGLSVYNFFTWLAFKWNHGTYRHVPITKSGGYMNVFIGMSNGKPLRAKYSERDLTGHLRVSRLSKLEQLDTFRDALYWKWTFATIRNVHDEVSEEPWYKRLGESWDKPMRVAMGSFGCYKYEEDQPPFDPTNRDMVAANRQYSRLRPVLTMSWCAWLKGLFSKTEPFSVEALKPPSEH